MTIARLESALVLQREEMRRQAEHWLEVNGRLEESLGIFKRLYEDAPVGYLTLSESGVVVDLNHRAASLLGLQPESARGRPLLFFVDRAASDDLLRHLERCRAGEAVVTSEIEFRVEPAASAMLELVTRRVLLPVGRIAYQTIVNDLSERRDTERLIAASEKRYREIVETANEGICKVDSANTITFGNRAFARLLGRSEDEILGAPFEQMLPADDVEAEREMFDRRDTGRLGVREHRLRRSDGTSVWTSVSTSLLVDEEGQFAGMLRMYTDISDRKALEAARDGLVRHLVAAQEAERHRVARELHDQMGQHLVGLSLGLNRLAQLGATSPEIRQITQRLQSLADIMAGDVRHLAFELRPASLDDLGLGDAVRNYADGLARRFGIEVDVQCDGLPRLETTAETTVYRIVQEALTNVVKHAHAQHLSVILERRGDRLQLIVEDDGIGFRPEQVLRRGSDSSGLGLRGMIERAALVGGEFQVESRPGHGTTLFLRVPLDGGEQASHEETTPAAG